MVDDGPPAGRPPAPVWLARCEPIRPARRWRRRLWLAAAVLGAPLALGAVATSAGVGAPPAFNAQRLDTGPRSGLAPTFELPDLVDPTRSVALADFRGRAVMINFWASWCVPCRKEMPRLAAAARRLEGWMVVLGVNYKDQSDEARDFVRETGVSYPSVMDRDGAVGDRYGVYGLPDGLGGCQRPHRGPLPRGDDGQDASPAAGATRGCFGVRVSPTRLVPPGSATQPSPRDVPVRRRH